MNYRITPLQDEDIESFRRTYLNALEIDWKTLEGINDREIWKNNFKTWIRESFTIFLLKVDESIVGYIAGDSTRILHVWVQREFRCNQYGKKLVEEFLKSQSNKGLNEFTLKTYDENVGFFKKIGATIQSYSSNFSILKFENN